MDLRRTHIDQNSWIYRGVLFITAILSLAAYLEIKNLTGAIGYLDLSSKWRLGITLIALIPGALWLMAFLSLVRPGKFIITGFARVGLFLKKLGNWTYLLYLACLVLFGYLLVGLVPNLMTGLFARIFLFWIFGLASYACIVQLKPNWTRFIAGIASLLILAVVFRIVSYLPRITNYPFSLDWSETSNYFYSSLFLARKLYGFSADLPLFNPARGLLGTVPFFLPEPQIWINRLWASFLWVACTGLTAFMLARRLRLARRLFSYLFAAWAFIFWLQAPIYYELLLSVAGVVLFLNGKHFWRSMLAVVLSSAWAGICRVNWFPMPGITAALLFFLETPISGETWWRYLWKPAAWVGAGLAAAVAAFSGYNLISGIGTSTTATALQSPLLWYRLLPSSTNQWGVLPTVLLAALPAISLIVYWLVKQGPQFNLWRKAGILLTLAGFFAGGIVVSVKIGGGSNIHNLDTFWFLLAIVTGYIYFERIRVDKNVENRSFHIPVPVTVGLIAVPVFFTLMLSLPSFYPNQNSVDQALNSIRQYISLARNEGKEVLFIDNKQLITFGYFPSTKMVTEYETVFMLEMAMTDNQSYYNKFKQDLQDKRFGVIVTYPQPTQLQDRSSAFSEENNAQINYLGKPLLCYYQEETTWLAVSIEIFTPRPQPKNCQ